tara:strand:+ start:1161 stop:1460 length:300 start_codon:yes stop_codon:yes gene_type:complete
METVILVSVLSTLGVVAIVGSIVVAFKKLNNKVDVMETHNIYQSIEEASSALNNRIDDSLQNLDFTIRDLEQSFQHDISEAHRTIDSRCDRLHDLITNK